MTAPLNEFASQAAVRALRKVNESAVRVDHNRYSISFEALVAVVHVLMNIGEYEEPQTPSDINQARTIADERNAQCAA